MTFEEHWQKVMNANSKLADDHFARALAEVAWEAATQAEREACAAVARKKFRVVGERNEAGNAIADDILKRSNATGEQPVANETNEG